MEQTTNAEIIRALDVIDHNLSFRSIDNDAAKYAKMFPDSEIAKGYSMHRSRINYVIGHGLEPYFKDKLLDDAKDKLFCIHFDEPTTKQIRKHYVYVGTVPTNLIVGR